MDILLVVMIAVLVFLVLVLPIIVICNEPDPTPKRKSIASGKQARNTHDDGPDYTQQNLQRIMRENALRMQDQAAHDIHRAHCQATQDFHRTQEDFSRTQQAAMDAHQMSVDMSNTMDFGCGGFGSFF